MRVKNYEVMSSISLAAKKEKDQKTVINWRDNQQSITVNFFYYHIIVHSVIEMDIFSYDEKLGRIENTLISSTKIVSGAPNSHHEWSLRLMHYLLQL